MSCNSPTVSSPVCLSDYPENWKVFIKQWLESNGISGNQVIMTEGPSLIHPETNHRMELVDLE